MTDKLEKRRPTTIPESLAGRLEPLVEKWMDEVKSLLPNVPEDLVYTWSNDYLIPGYGTGGTATNPKLIELSFDGEASSELLKKLKGTVYHECFHIVQGWTDENPTLPANYLEAGILEGCATKFEMIEVGTDPMWGQIESDEEMTAWLAEVNSLGSYNSDTYRDYMWGEIDGRKWILYRLGTWIATKALANNPNLQIADLATMNPSRILELADLSPEA